LIKKNFSNFASFHRNEGVQKSFKERGAVIGAIMGLAVGTAIITGLGAAGASIALYQSICTVIGIGSISALVGHNIAEGSIDHSDYRMLMKGSTRRNSNKNGSYNKYLHKLMALGEVNVPTRKSDRSGMQLQ